MGGDNDDGKVKVERRYQFGVFFSGFYWGIFYFQERNEWWIFPVPSLGLIISDRELEFDGDESDF